MPSKTTFLNLPRKKWSLYDEDDEICTYEIQIQGQVEEKDINVTSPLQLTFGQYAEASTSAVLRTDQSGMIGLIRHLHGLGIILLSIRCVTENLPDPDMD